MGELKSIHQRWTGIARKFERKWSKLSYILVKQLSFEYEEHSESEPSLHSQKTPVRLVSDFIRASVNATRQHSNIYNVLREKTYD